MRGLCEALSAVLLSKISYEALIFQDFDAIFDSIDLHQVEKDISLQEIFFPQSWRIYADALAGGPGYAYDANTEFRYHTGTIGTFGFGYRTLGGGADNDKLKNFARFNAWTLAYMVGVD